MNRFVQTLVLIGMLVGISPALLAQWGPHPSPNVPKTATGEPDLNAPPPRTADGHVDFSGIWKAGRAGGGQRGQRGAGGAAAGAAGRGQGAAPAAGPAAGRGAGQGAGGGAGQGAGGGRGARGARGGGGQAAAADPNAIPVATFGNAGQGFPDDLPFQPWARDLMNQRRADNSKDNPDAHCLPMGFMQFHNHPEPNKIIQTPEEIIIIYEANSGLRELYLDGRSLPPKDAEPWWYGYSVAKWEGDTLVVTTTRFRDGGWLDVRGSPLTDEATVIERFRRPNFGTLEIDITVDDPKAYTKPWTVRINQYIMLDTSLIEFICEDRDATHYVGAQP